MYAFSHFRGINNVQVMETLFWVASPWLPSWGLASLEYIMLGRSWLVGYLGPWQAYRGLHTR